MPNDGTIPYEEDPDHMIILLDTGIGDPDKYQHLKLAISSTTDPKNETPVKLVDTEFDKILRAEGPLPINFEGVRFLLAAFTEIDPCVHCFEQNQHKRIFFIVSGQLGQIAVPIILTRFPRIFTDPVTNQPYTSIYVFCHSIELQMNWALDYRYYIQIFNFDAELLSRLIRDAGDYFVIESRRLLEEDPPNNASAKHRLTWAHELYQRYCKLEKVQLKTEFEEVNALLDELDEEMASSSEEDD